MLRYISTPLSVTNIFPTICNATDFSCKADCLITSLVKILCRWHSKTLIISVHLVGKWIESEAAPQRTTGGGREFAAAARDGNEMETLIYSLVSSASSWNPAPWMFDRKCDTDFLIYVLHTIDYKHAKMLPQSWSYLHSEVLFAVEEKSTNLILQSYHQCVAH